MFDGSIYVKGNRVRTFLLHCVDRKYEFHDSGKQFCFLKMLEAKLGAQFENNSPAVYGLTIETA